MRKESYIRYFKEYMCKDASGDTCAFFIEPFSFSCSLTFALALALARARETKRPIQESWKNVSGDTRAFSVISSFHIYIYVSFGV